MGVVAVFYRRHTHFVYLFFLWLGYIAGFCVVKRLGVSGCGMD
jgi:hypothetical protein